MADFYSDDIIELMKEGFEELPESYWYDTMNRINEKFAGEKPSPMQIRAEVLLELAGIPSGQYSAIQTDKEGNRTDSEGDKIIAENITNKAGLLINGTQGITSRDLRDRYPEGLPKEVLEHLDEKTKKIVMAMYEYEKFARENSPGTSDYASSLVHLHFLPGGIPYVSVGVGHTKEWMGFYGRFMKDMGKEAEVVSVEGYANNSAGKSLHTFWKKEGKDGGWGTIMRSLVSWGYESYFTEVDGRDESRVSLDSKVSLSGKQYSAHLPGSFYKKYLEYLKKEDSRFGNAIGTPEKLKSFFKKQSVPFINEQNINYTERDKKMYAQRTSLTDTGEKSTELTGNELGILIYSDAISAVKLHLLGRMMNDGVLPKGPIVDYEGLLHLSIKSFFIQNPEYAMEIVLRTLPNLLSGISDSAFFNYLTTMEFSEKVFDRTDWAQVIREIFRIPLKKVADPKPCADGVEIGKNQRPMIEAHPDEYVLENILASQKPGKRELKDWVNEMETLIEKFAEKK